jgi:hypothetical protein
MKQPTALGSDPKLLVVGGMERPAFGVDHLHVPVHQSAVGLRRELAGETLHGGRIPDVVSVEERDQVATSRLEPAIRRADDALVARLADIGDPG